jgi:ABC-type branched-subunit amino acid transport system ATPase component
MLNLKLKLKRDQLHRIVVIVQGSTIANGTPSEVINNKLVIDAYLGELDYEVS